MLFTQHRCLVLDVMSISLLETAEPDRHPKTPLAIPGVTRADAGTWARGWECDGDVRGRRKFQCGDREEWVVVFSNSA